MPKGTKGAPPQQSKLSEMWGKGKKRAQPVKEDDDIDMAGEKAADAEVQGTQHTTL